MKKYILSLLGIFVAMAFIASCQQEGTTVTEEPNSAPPGVNESSRAVTDTLAQETRVDFGLRENVRADEKQTAFVELESAIRCV